MLDKILCFFGGHKKLVLPKSVMQIDIETDRILTALQVYDIKKVITIELCDRCHEAYWESHQEIIPLRESGVEP